MIAFDIAIDGEHVVVAGVADWSMLALHVDAARGRRGTGSANSAKTHIRFSVGGLSMADASGIRHHFRWKEKDLAMGSTVTVSVVDVEAPDAPIRRYRSEKGIGESPFTDEELREMRRQHYLELKKEFENDTPGS